MPERLRKIIKRKAVPFLSAAGRIRSRQFYVSQLGTILTENGGTNTWLAGVDLPREKRIEIGLTYIYGIGRSSADRILEKAGVNPDTRVRDITDEEVGKIRDAIEELQIPVEGDLRREIALNIKRLQEIGCYRGIRHRKGLPVRGQKTKTNARTRKGPKRTVANKKK